MDWKRPYGSISGSLDTHPGARYFQDGRYFNANGDEVAERSAKKVETIEGPVAIADLIVAPADDEPLLDVEVNLPKRRGRLPKVL
jgi:hypothetical protein